jgi:hypothetical protein
VLAGNTVALATTGHAILAGKVNKATKMTTVTRTTAGTTLQVKTKSAANAPFAVNGKGKVVNLNADTVDGYEGGTRVLNWEYTGAVSGDKVFTLTGLAPGTYLIDYEVYFSALSSADGLPINCYLSQSVGGTHFGGESNGAESAASYPGLNGTALMTQPVGGNMSLNCFVEGAATWNAPASQPVRITAIPIAGVTAKGAPSASRIAARQK